MLGNKLIATLLVSGVLAASVSSAAVARDHGNGNAIAAGILGAVVVGSLIAASTPVYAAPAPYYAPPPVYQAPPQAYYAPPVQTYYQAPAPVYYEAAPQYYPAPVVVYERRHHRHEGYYGRGY